MLFWVTIVFLPIVSSHVPTFPSDNVFQVGDIQGKSWGIYSNTNQNILYKLSGNKGDPLTLSISSTMNEDLSGYVDLILSGPNIATVNCSQDWNGWKPVRRLNEDPDSLILQGRTFGKAEFEPFGVGGYLPLVACNTTFPSTGEYQFQVRQVGINDVSYSIGAGMTESFSLVELLTMSFLVANTWIWAGSSWGLLLFPMFVSLIITIWLYTHQKRERTTWRILMTLGAMICLSSSITFLFQLLNVASYNIHIGKKLWIPLIFHIDLPFVWNVILLFGIVKIHHFKTPVHSPLIPFIFGFIFSLIQFFLTWQSYIIGPLLILLGSFSVWF